MSMHDTDFQKYYYTSNFGLQVFSQPDKTEMKECRVITNVKELQPMDYDDEVLDKEITRIYPGIDHKKMVEYFILKFRDVISKRFDENKKKLESDSDLKRKCSCYMEVMEKVKENAIKACQSIGGLCDRSYKDILTGIHLFEGLSDTEINFFYNDFVESDLPFDCKPLPPFIHYCMDVFNADLVNYSSGGFIRIPGRFQDDCFLVNQFEYFKHKHFFRYFDYSKPLVNQSENAILLDTGQPFGQEQLSASRNLHAQSEVEYPTSIQQQPNPVESVALQNKPLPSNELVSLEIPDDGRCLFTAWKVKELLMASGSNSGNFKEIAKILSGQKFKIPTLTDEIKKGVAYFQKLYPEGDKPLSENEEGYLLYSNLRGGGADNLVKCLTIHPELIYSGKGILSELGLNLNANFLVEGGKDYILANCLSEYITNFILPKLKMAVSTADSTRPYQLEQKNNNHFNLYITRDEFDKIYEAKAKLHSLSISDIYNKLLNGVNICKNKLQIASNVNTAYAILSELHALTSEYNKLLNDDVENLLTADDEGAFDAANRAAKEMFHITKNRLRTEQLSAGLQSQAFQLNPGEADTAMMNALQDDLEGGINSLPASRNYQESDLQGYGPLARSVGGVPLNQVETDSDVVTFNNDVNLNKLDKQTQTSEDFVDLNKDQHFHDSMPELRDTDVDASGFLWLTRQMLLHPPGNTMHEANMTRNLSLPEKIAFRVATAVLGVIIAPFELYLFGIGILAGDPSRERTVEENKRILINNANTLTQWIIRNGDIDYKRLGEAGKNLASLNKEFTTELLSKMTNEPVRMGLHTAIEAERARLQQPEHHV